MSLRLQSRESMALHELIANREAYLARRSLMEARGSTITRPHSADCVVRRAAPLLLGVDRRGMCTCGAEVAA